MRAGCASRVERVVKLDPSMDVSDNSTSLRLLELARRTRNRRQARVLQSHGLCFPHQGPVSYLPRPASSQFPFHSSLPKIDALNAFSSTTAASGIPTNDLHTSRTFIAVVQCSRLTNTRVDITQGGGGIEIMYLGSIFLISDPHPPFPKLLYCSIIFSRMFFFPKKVNKRSRIIRVCVLGTLSSTEEGLRGLPLVKTVTKVNLMKRSHCQE